MIRTISSVMFFFFSSRRRHTRWTGDWSSDVCSSDLGRGRSLPVALVAAGAALLTCALRRSGGLASECAGIPGAGVLAAAARPGVHRPGADAGRRRGHGPDAGAAAAKGAVVGGRAGLGGVAGAPGGGLAALAGGAAHLRPAGGAP